jgi:hypothetical protein
MVFWKFLSPLIYQFVTGMNAVHTTKNVSVPIIYNWWREDGQKLQIVGTDTFFKSSGRYLPRSLLVARGTG